MILRVIQNKSEGDNYFSLVIEKPTDFNFYPGQYLDIDLNNDSRAFTISSSPSENFLMITTKKGLTPFKKFLEKLKNGDTITSSHPVGTFTLDESSPAVFIAGGIGITPFRSAVKYVLDNKIPTAINLIYCSSGDFAFKNEFDLWHKQLPNLEIIYINTNKTGRLKTLDTKYLIPNTIYYLAGSHAFVDDLEKILLNLGVDQANIRTDKFDGY